jgi:carbon monoxide dehydrogenase subunit G
MTLIYILVVVVTAFVVIVSVQPSEFSVSRSISIDAPPETVFAQVNDLHKWQEWSPWAKLDPSAKIDYEGPMAGVGAAFAWTGNCQVGQGRMAITENRPNEQILFKIEFAKPMKATNTAEFIFRPDGQQTVVKWTMFGKKNFICKAMGLAVNCDKMIGTQFEKGLADMKLLAQAAAQSRGPLSHIGV